MDDSKRFAHTQGNIFDAMLRNLRARENYAFMQGFNKRASGLFVPAAASGFADRTDTQIDVTTTSAHSEAPPPTWDSVRDTIERVHREIEEGDSKTREQLIAMGFPEDAADVIATTEPIPCRFLPEGARFYAKGFQRFIIFPSRETGKVTVLDISCKWLERMPPIVPVLDSDLRSIARHTYLRYPTVMIPTKVRLPGNLISRMVAELTWEMTWKTRWRGELERQRLTVRCTQRPRRKRRK